MPWRRALAFLVLCLSSFAFARSGALSLNKSLDLSDYKGKTFLETMMKPGGIKEALDADEKDSFEIAGKAKVLRVAQESFHPNVLKKILKYFSQGKTGFGKLLDALEGTKATPASVAGVIAKKLNDEGLLNDSGKVGLAAVTVAPLISLASGAGTLVTLNSHSYTYHFGYKPGSTDRDELARHVKSGRSFGASAGHLALDASDIEYLTELEAYLKRARNPSDFYETLLQVLTQSDPSGYEDLTSDAETTATDFFAIYTAELDRNIMTGLKQHPWQNDLAEVTLLSAFGTKAGLVEKNGEIVEGHPTDYFGVGPGGSGIGETRRDRRKLQIAVTKAEKALHPKVVFEVETLLGDTQGDVFHALMVYLNEPKKERNVHVNARNLINAVSKFVMQTREDADEITQAIRQ